MSLTKISVLRLITTLNFSLGTIYRILVLRLITREGIVRHPINFMTAFDESVKLFTYVWMIFAWWTSIELFDSKPLAHYTGAWFCKLSKFIGTLALCSNITNGTGMLTHTGNSTSNAKAYNLYIACIKGICAGFFYITCMISI